MNEVVFLDTTPLWLACISRSKPNSDRDLCIHWLEYLRSQGRIVVIPEIADYETRRKLIHKNLDQPGQWAKAIQRLNELEAANHFLPLNTEMILKAAELWASLRHQGTPTAAYDRLDADVIIAAQAIVSDNGRNQVIVATRNVGHLSRMVPAEDWWKIT